MITLDTTLGKISLELDFENTPVTAKNFLTLAQSGFFDGTIFHRVIKNFMIQGGGFDDKMKQKQGAKTITNEAKNSQKNLRGTIAMARTSDPHSASSQFFINAKDNNFLDFKSESSTGWGYCVFGKVTSGMEVVDQIQNVNTTSRAGHEDVPTDIIKIDSVIVE